MVGRFGWENKVIDFIMEFIAGQTHKHAGRCDFSYRDIRV